MQLDEKKRRLIVIGIAILLILMGAIEGLFKIKIDRKIMDEVSFVLMMIAAWLLLSGRKFGKKDPEKEKAEPTTETSSVTIPVEQTPSEITPSAHAAEDAPQLSSRSKEPEQKG